MKYLSVSHLARGIHYFVAKHLFHSEMKTNINIFIMQKAWQNQHIYQGLWLQVAWRTVLKKCIQ